MPPEHALVVNNIKKRFGDLTVLNGISLTAHKGDVISLLGSSGSGKSTLLRCINLLETPDEGEVYVTGERIEMTRDRHGKTVPKSQKQVDHIRTRLGMVFQGFNLWSHRTILENIISARACPRYSQSRSQRIRARIAQQSRHCQQSGQLP